jgi:hypothetical protein
MTIQLTINTTTEYILNGSQINIWKTLIYLQVYCIIIHNNKDTESNEVPINGGIDKKILYIYTLEL